MYLFLKKIINKVKEVYYRKKTIRTFFLLFKLDNIYIRGCACLPNDKKRTDHPRHLSEIVVRM